MKTIRQGMVGSLVLMAILMVVTGPVALETRISYRARCQFQKIENLVSVTALKVGWWTTQLTQVISTSSAIPA